MLSCTLLGSHRGNGQLPLWLGVSVLQYVLDGLSFAYRKRHSIFLRPSTSLLTSFPFWFGGFSTALYSGWS